jgi:hypothetical protein
MRVSHVSINRAHYQHRTHYPFFVEPPLSRLTSNFHSEFHSPPSLASPPRFVGEEVDELRIDLTGEAAADVAADATFDFNDDRAGDGTGLAGDGSEVENRPRPCC